MHECFQFHKETANVKILGPFLAWHHPLFNSTVAAVFRDDDDDSDEDNPEKKKMQSQLQGK